MDTRSFSEKLNKYVIKFSSNIIIRTISAGMARILPVMIVASVAQILLYLPIDAWTEFIKNNGIATLLGSVNFMTSNLISIYIVIALANEMAKIYRKDNLNAILISLLAFFIITPTRVVEISEKSTEILNTRNFGSVGIFAGMITAILATYLYVKLTESGKLRIKMPKDVPPAIASSIEPLIIAIVIAAVFVAFAGLVKLTPFGDVHTLIYSYLQKPLEGLGMSLATMLIITFIGECLWWFGIHGSNVTSAVIATIFTPLSIANMQAVAAGLAPQYILNDLFLGVYKGPRHLVLALMLLFITRSKHYKAIGKVAIVPGFFGISEPMKFGIPMIFNPLVFIPMALSPVISITIAYIASVIGFLSPVSIAVPWIMPPFISGFLANGFAGVVVQAIQVVAIFALWLPFLKMMDRNKVKEEAALAETENA